MTRLLVRAAALAVLLAACSVLGWWVAIPAQTCLVVLGMASAAVWAWAKIAAAGDAIDEQTASIVNPRDRADVRWVLEQQR